MGVPSPSVIGPTHNQAELIVWDMYHCQVGAAGEDVLEFGGHLRILPMKMVQTGVASSRYLSHPFFLSLSQMTLNWIRQITNAAITVQLTVRGL